MGTDNFEGYIGIYIENGQLVHDILLVLILLLLSVFAIVFRNYFPLFMKMFKGVISIKERQSLFDSSMRGDFFLKIFMNFQVLFLCTLFCYMAFCRFMDMEYLQIKQAFTLIAVFFGLVVLFYLLKQCLYSIYGYVFNESDKCKLWSRNYRTLFYIWGVLLYLPVLWIIYDSEHLKTILFLFAFSCILYRFAVFHITFRIFYTKKTGMLYFSSYLCAQEIVPLLLLYESLNYLYNVIETNTLWH